MTRTFVLAMLLAGTPSAHAVELPRMFSDGMVLQRDQPIPVWGRATPGAKVVVTFGGKPVSAVADAKGNWRVTLSAHAAGGPLKMRIDDGSAPVELDDVLVGDVWLASGQSNMEWPLSQTDDADAAIAAANDPLIRHFKIPKSWSSTPQWQLQGGEWVSASPASVGQFSAAAYYMAVELRKATDVPIGIIDSTWGGSRIEAWMDAPTQGLNPADSFEAERKARADDERATAEARRRLAQWPESRADDSGWQAPGLDTSTWASIKVPGIWESQGWAIIDGVAWYRTAFNLSAAEAKAGVTLAVGRIDDSDTTWVNGVQVGQTTLQYNLPRAYAVPASALHAGRNEVAVKVTDLGGGGGVHGVASELHVQLADGSRRPLDGEWRFRIADARLVPADDNKNQFPTLLYNAMIHPLQPYALRGAIWYQGESNAYAVAESLRYRTLFPAMIQQWRTQWQAPSMPFLWVQLASFGSGADTPGESPWSVLRESQSATLALPATAQVVTIDIGDRKDIHPRNKRDVGERLALAARAVAYGESLVHRGPMRRGLRFADHAAIVDFDTGGAVLVARGGGHDVRGFQMAGADRVFHPARARIDGDRVVVHSDSVVTPVAVRYGWRDDAGDADLVNSAGLPASPFRSDDW
ncbi:sialate O-acetylesterase [Thermomonas carbonis]|uniref:Beta galactosidase jelly roll domain-containing protein n=1 Tax=Thermomonas carbonis TaxID=1463158 RepID=A0A7G9SP27_9GAMM|nr:sialate O-acetylesterase [Thermomonas carbonis]QNN69602.1 beta galactosidase jelly roll domain-containing protein [Thermomonas carbonis]GHB94222.1 9-O-acetylesterase [Thermomonas carbonis]